MLGISLSFFFSYDDDNDDYDFTVKRIKLHSEYFKHMSF